MTTITQKLADKIRTGVCGDPGYALRQAASICLLAESVWEGPGNQNFLWVSDRLRAMSAQLKKEDKTP